MKSGLDRVKSGHEKEQSGLAERGQPGRCCLLLGGASGVEWSKGGGCCCSLQGGKVAGAWVGRQAGGGSSRCWSMLLGAVRTHGSKQLGCFNRPDPRAKKKEKEMELGVWVKMNHNLIL